MDGDGYISNSIKELPWGSNAIAGVCNIMIKE